MLEPTHKDQVSPIPNPYIPKSMVKLEQFILERLTIALSNKRSIYGGIPLKPNGGTLVVEINSGMPGGGGGESGGSVGWCTCFFEGYGHG